MSLQYHGNLFCVYMLCPTDHVPKQKTINYSHCKRDYATCIGDSRKRYSIGSQGLGSISGFIILQHTSDNDKLLPHRRLFLHCGEHHCTEKDIFVGGGEQ